MRQIPARDARGAGPGVRFSVRLALACVLASALSAVLGFYVAPPQKLPADTLGWADFVVRLEAATSVHLWAATALAVGIVAAIYALYVHAMSPAGLERAAPQTSLRLGRRIDLKTEFLLISLILAVLFTINLVTIEIYPMVWIDEAGYTDPGINLAIGNGLTSSVWPNVYWGRFWYSFPPLFPVLLAPWIKLLGVDLAVIRSFNLVLIVGVAFGLWAYAVRSGLLPSLIARVGLAALPLLGYGISFSYRNARPDILSALIAVLALNATLLHQRRWRAAALILIGALVPWAGPHLPAFAGILAVLVGVWWPRYAVSVFFALAIGIALGVAGLFGFYLAEGQLYGFLASTFGSVNSITGQIAQLVLLHDARSLPHFQQLPSLLLGVILEDRSSLFLLTAAVLLCLSLRNSKDGAAYKASRFGVTAGLGIPILTALAGQYWLNYTWTALLTVGTAVAVALANYPNTSAERWPRGLAAGCFCLALLFGLPIQLSAAYLQRQARSYDAVRAFVGRAVSPGDWIYVAPQAYFAVAERGATPVVDEYARGRLAPGIPQDQRERIKAFIVHPGEVEDAMQRLGGSWEAVPPEFEPPAAMRLTWGEWDESDEEYHLVLYRRR
jgi:hypothetical protein